MLQSYIDSIVALAIDGKINIRFNVFPPQSPYFLVPKVVYQLTKNKNAKYRDGMFTKTETEKLMRAIEEELYKDPVNCEHFRKLLSVSLLTKITISLHFGGYLSFSDTSCSGSGDAWKARAF